MPFELPPLPYAYNALEPFIDEATMHYHHDGHHAAYVKNLNAALENSPLAQWPVEKLLRNLQEVPESARTAVRNNGGGHANHTMFWQIMKPQGGGQPSGALSQAIHTKFGDFESFKKAF
ncbi:MAG: superoxide dismutase, partial [Planctomycetes bacterium]|nr:superoxide dismutase [Planctomycetota bacterium]